ncbi:Zinc finger, RING-type [Dillenia turbinata]|uniref:Zinc finger, RING-type n=1 Tax=Dillenia turbinata TaxID=194707 RepID=A0AAN8WD22_9MAGN
MAMEFDYLNTEIPAEIVERFEELFPDLSLEEVLRDQESVYQSFQTDRNICVSSSDNVKQSSPEHVSQEKEISWNEDVDSQIAFDEALAQSLQDMEDEFDNLNVSVDTRSSSAHSAEQSDVPTPPTSRVAVHEDDVDPDNMTFEERQSLGESIGSVCRGLSEEDIARLPTSKYNSGWFSKKNDSKDNQCVICYSKYRNGDKLTSLLCAHQYHSECVTKWLKLNKIQPDCKSLAFACGADGVPY